MNEVRNKKYGGSMKQSEYDLLVKLANDMQLSQVEVIVRALEYYSKKVEKLNKREVSMFEPKKE